METLRPEVASRVPLRKRFTAAVRGMIRSLFRLPLLLLKPLVFLWKRKPILFALPVLFAAGYGIRACYIKDEAECARKTDRFDHVMKVDRVSDISMRIYFRSPSSGKIDLQTVGCDDMGVVYDAKPGEEMWFEQVTKYGDGCRCVQGIVHAHSPSEIQ